MKYLLDACAFLWFAEGNAASMSQAARNIIEGANNEISISAISFWELSMKSVVGKLSLSLSPSELEQMVLTEGFVTLPLDVSHIERFHQLPITHRDPFDRLLAAIALTNDFIIVSPDPAFDTLEARRVW